MWIMPFPYYKKLSREMKRVYRLSDAMEKVPIQDKKKIQQVVLKLGQALESEDMPAIKKYSSSMCKRICEDLKVENVGVKILSQRPSNSQGELQGLYEREEGKRPKITIWMKTARKKKVVAFKTFLRTLLHEFLHHLDYAYFDFPDSLHTEGFFKRESDLFRQIMPFHEEKKKPGRKPKSKTTSQMKLF